MEDFLVSVLKIMDRKLSKQFTRLESIIKKNNKEFKECLNETQKIRKSIVVKPKYKTRRLKKRYSK